ncbi:MAG: hypothetical protein HQL74_13615 [Magnetococcales bacterium]|nr:hypothetical protein [Magnetococcales bacterium]
MMVHWNNGLKWLLPAVWGAVLVLVVPVAWAEANKPEVQQHELGRLFTTARERTALKSARRRALAISNRKKHEADRTPSEPLAKPDRVVINGMMTRSGGPAAVWMNHGSALRTADVLPDGVQIDGAGTGTVVVQLPGSKRLVTLQPGQRFDDKVNRVLEAYEVARIDEEELKKNQEKKRKEAKAKVKAGDSKGDAAKGDKKADAKATGDKGAAAKAIDRMGLGADGAALSDMMNQREQFKERLDGLKVLLGK